VGREVSAGVHFESRRNDSRFSIGAAMLTYEKTDVYAPSISDAAMHRLATETAQNARTAVRHQILVAIAFGIVAGYFLLREGHSILEWFK
jgi:hypothetical protein